MQAKLDKVAEQVEDVYLHIDMDALDPEIAPGIVDHPVPGGLSVPQVEDLIRAVCGRFRVIAAALTTYTPGRDRDGRTWRTDLYVLEVLAECWSLKKHMNPGLQSV